MSFKCASCGTEITRYVLVGTYLLVDWDLPDIERDGSCSMRISGRFNALAMLECPECGTISFLNLKKARSLGLQQIPSNELYPANGGEHDK